MHVWGLLTGFATFGMIGIFHPIVVKTEYYFGAKVWPMFLIAGLLICLLSLQIANLILSNIVAVFGFCLLWSVVELKEQEKRVKRGWFPENKKRK